MSARQEQPGWTDQEIEARIGNLLRTGVLAAAAVVLCGAVVYLARHGADRPDYHVFRGEPSDLCSLPGVLTDIVHFSGRGIIQLGFLLLIATPVLRVVACSLAFGRQRDRLYVVVSLIVLSFLTYSLFFGSLL